MDGLAISAWRGPTLAAEDGTSLRMTSAIASGDAEAFARFYEQWFDWMYQMARSITKRDESFCLDVTQDAMLRVVRSMRPMRTEDDLRRWLMRVTHTAALDLLRAEARRRRRERGAMALGAAEPGGVGLDEQIESLRQRIERLSPEDRGLLQLRFGRGAALRVAGGGSAAAAHGRLRRIVQRLRETMEETDEL
ncbi:MAG: RNA polymerase sigma factor [Phycisphaerales bacterium JB039]